MAWSLADHACRHCFGRLLSGAGGVWRCAECGAQHRGEVEGLCWCGVEVPGVGRPYRCVRNHGDQAIRQEIVVEELTDVEVESD